MKRIEPLAMAIHFKGRKFFESDWTALPQRDKDIAIEQAKAALQGLIDDPHQQFSLTDRQRSDFQSAINGAEEVIFA